MTSTTMPMTVSGTPSWAANEESQELLRTNRNGTSLDELRYEVIDGQVVELPPMGFFEVGIATLLVEYLAPFVRQRGLGRVRNEGLFNLGKEIGRQRRPDVAFYSFARWPKGRRLPRTNASPVVPNLAVEVVSPTDLAEEVQGKVNEYFRAGVEEVWVIWPDLRQVHIYTSPTEMQGVTFENAIEGRKLLPGFRLPVAALFEDEPEEEESAPPTA